MNVTFFCLQFKFDKARQKIYQNPTCVYDTLPRTGRTALHELCSQSVLLIDCNSYEAPEEYSDDDDDGNCQYTYLNRYHFHIKHLAQLIIETSHLLLQKSEVVSQYTSHSFERSILITEDCNGNIPLRCICQDWNSNKYMLSVLFGFCRESQSLLDSAIPTVMDLMLHEDFMQVTPLHLISHCICSFSVWKLLLDQFPVGKDNYLLSQVQDCDGETPWHWAFMNKISNRRLVMYLKTFGKEGLYSRNNIYETPLNKIVMDDFDSAQSMWDRVAMIMYVILERDEPTLPMFALAELSDMIPTKWLELGLDLYQGGLDDVDDQGRSPLHVVGMCPSRELGDHHFLALWAENPDVAQRRCHQGRLPLHYVLEAGKSKCVEVLLLEYPDQFYESDPVSGLPCFLLAIATDTLMVTDDSMACLENRLNNCYTLLRKNPDVIHRLGNLH